MASFHQIGHNSENLLFEQSLSGFSGAILSPVNYSPAETADQLARIEEDLSADFVALLDPQMYVPQSARGTLRDWEYFPKDVDTADLSSLAWWSALNAKILVAATQLQVESTATPITLPKGGMFSDEYFAFMVAVGNDMIAQAGSDLDIRQTAVVGMRELAVPDRASADRVPAFSNGR